MRKIRTYIQRPWKFSDSPYYNYLTKNVSEKIEYVNVQGKDNDIVKNLGKFKGLNKVKRAIKLALRNFFPYLPNAHLTPKSEYDLIHCAHCLSLNKRPWVVDVEYVNQFWAGGIPKKQKRLISSLLTSKYCKKILAWTEWTKKSILDIFPEVKDKIEVIYPALQAPHFKKAKSNKINLLFVSRRFYFKGGLHALEVIDRLTKKHKNVEGFFISDVPEDVLRKYGKNNKIKFIKFMDREKLFAEIYPKTDILIYPSYTDTLGFSILEALSFGVPVITVDGQSRKELVEHGKTGFVIDGLRNLDLKDLENTTKLKETIDSLEKFAEKLIIDKKLREKMSLNALNKFKNNGQFSIYTRNKKLENVYLEALNKNDNNRAW